MPVLGPEAQLRSMVQADEDPNLSNDEVDTLLHTYRIISTFNEWLPATVYTLGNNRVPRFGNDHYYVVTVAGTSGPNEPAFPVAPFATVTDGTVTWQEAGTYASYNLRKAAGAGWLLKAAKVANRYDVDVDRFQRLKRDQLIQHCLEMAKQFNGRFITSTRFGGAYTQRIDPVIGNVNSG